MASYWVPVQWITTILGSSQGQSRISSALSLPLDKRNFPSTRLMADRLYSTLKYHLRFLGGCAVGSVARRSRQLLSEAKKDWTHASAVWACNFLEVNRRMRCLGLSQRPLCRTVR